MHQLFFQKDSITYTLKSIIEDATLRNGGTFRTHSRPVFVIALRGVGAVVCFDVSCVVELTIIETLHFYIE